MISGTGPVSLREIDTPAVLLDLGAMESNLAQVARFFSAGPTGCVRITITTSARFWRCARSTRGHRHDVRHALGSGGFGLGRNHQHPDFERTCRRPQDRATCRSGQAGRHQGVVDNPRAVAALGAAGRAKGQRLGVLMTALQDCCWSRGASHDSAGPFRHVPA